MSVTLKWTLFSVRKLQWPGTEWIPVQVPDVKQLVDTNYNNYNHWLHMKIMKIMIMAVYENYNNYEI